MRRGGQGLQAFTPDLRVHAQVQRLQAGQVPGRRQGAHPRRCHFREGQSDRDQARQNAPLAVTALDRLVSTQDYADFARTFAGIGKASATRLSDGRHQLVHVTIAGADDVPSDRNSDLALMRELHGIRDKIQEHLANSSGITLQPFRNIIRNVPLQTTPSFACRHNAG